jgi:uncharacterized GH25 family protein
MEGLLPIWMTSLGAVATSIAAIITVLKFSRNGRQSSEYKAKQEAAFDTQVLDYIEYIKKKIDDPDNGLSAIKKATEAMRLHCAQVSTRIESQVKTNTDEISILRKK